MPDPELETAILETLTIHNKWMTPMEMADRMVQRFPNKWRGISAIHSARCRVAKTMRIMHEDGKLMKMEGIDKHVRYRR